MITVTISVNGSAIYTRSAVNKTEGTITDATVCLYRMDDGSIIKHRYGDRAVSLAIKMLKRIIEP